MTKKVNFFDKRVREVYGKLVSLITTVLSLILIFVEIPDSYKVTSGIVFVAILVLSYLWIWRYANKLTNIDLNIEGSIVHIITGDIFDQDGLKVIPFNEYFDTQVDDRIISKRSLNGQYIEKFFPDTLKLNQLIQEDKDLNIDENVLNKGINREGNTVQYKLGSSLRIEDFVLTAFTKFNDKNMAQLSMYEYLNFLLYFWNEINRVHAQTPVNVPVFGSGITRFKNGFEDIDDNELLDIMIWTFKVSKIKFKYPAKLTIVIHEKKIDKMDIFKLKEMEK
ncbi:macro domain-containing protein [Aerococcus urinaeequi]|uniref:macro domain-containing protein n=1 Tax=Aerococcus urinaeequi TaxID=51665 RepID=UPI003B3A6F5B